MKSVLLLLGVTSAIQLRTSDEIDGSGAGKCYDNYGGYGVINEYCTSDFESCEESQLYVADR